jgi:arylsulfatase A-like enzyme
MTSKARFLCLALALAAPACRDAAPPPRPNVILLTLDTTRADRLSCYGYPELTSPTLDALAAEGTRFDLAVSTASVTPVSHASILTGLYNHQHGVRVLYAGGGYRLPEEVQTLATVLRGAGYRTLAVHSAFPVSRFFGLERGFDVFEDVQSEIRHDEDAVNEYGWDMKTHQRRSDETTDLVLEKLGAEPFFLWIHYWDPHDLARLPPGRKLKDAFHLELSPGEQPFYDEEITYMDAQIARLFEGLRARGMYDDALIVVVADHGQGLGDHKWAAHRLLYQEQIRVPLIVRVPSSEQAPVVEDLVRTVDIFPTVLDYLELPSPRPLAGRSLRPLLEGRADEPRLAFADQINGYDWNAGLVAQRPLDDFLYLAMDREWKLTYRPAHFDESELYHLPSDPGEATNLFRKEPERARAMLELLAHEAPWVEGEFTPVEAGMDAEEVQRTLAELGYTGSTTVDAAWAWTCPRHLDQRRDERGPCPECGTPPLLISR